MKLKLFLLFCIIHLIWVPNCEGCIYWVPLRNGSITMDAVQGGWDSETLYVSRFHVQDGMQQQLIPGSLYPSHGLVRGATVDQIFSGSEYEVLGNCIAKWDGGHFLEILQNDVPALIGGYDGSGNPIYVCRFEYEMGTFIGWAGPPSPDAKCYFSMQDSVRIASTFQYLFCINV